MGQGAGRTGCASPRHVETWGRKHWELSQLVCLLGDGSICRAGAILSQVLGVGAGPGQGWRGQAQVGEASV